MAMSPSEVPAYVTLLCKGNIAAARPSSASPNRQYGVRPIGKRVESPSNLNEGDLGLVWKRPRIGAPAVEGSPGEITSVESLQQSDVFKKMVSEAVKEQFDESFERMFKARFKDLDVETLQKLSEKKVIRNVSKYFHTRTKSTVGASWMMRYNKLMDDARKEKRISAHHKGSSKVSFNLEVRSTMEGLKDKLISEKHKQDLRVRLEEIRKVVDEDPLFANLGTAYLEIEKAYSELNEELHEEPTETYLQQVQEMIHEGRFDKYGPGVPAMLEKMLACLA